MAKIRKNKARKGGLKAKGKTRALQYWRKITTPQKPNTCAMGGTAWLKVRKKGYWGFYQAEKRRVDIITRERRKS